MEPVEPVLVRSYEVEGERWEGETIGVFHSTIGEFEWLLRSYSDAHYEVMPPPTVWAVLNERGIVSRYWARRWYRSHGR